MSEFVVLYCTPTPLTAWNRYCPKGTAFLWLVPLTLQWQTALYSISEILYAWSTIDVITLSVVAAQLQIKQFVAFIVGNHCNAINVAIATLADGVFGPGELAELCTLFDLRAF